MGKLEEAPERPNGLAPVPTARKLENWTQTQVGLPPELSLPHPLSGPSFHVGPVMLLDEMVSEGLSWAKAHSQGLRHPPFSSGSGAERLLGACVLGSREKTRNSVPILKAKAV